MPPPLRVASWNIHKGVGADRRRDIFRTAEVMQELCPDILALQEADRRFGDRAGLLDLEHVRSQCGLVPVLPETPGPSHGWHGNLLFLREGRIERIHPLNLPGLEPRGALFADLTVGGIALRVIGVHLGLLPASRRAQAHALLDHLSRLPPRPTLLMGDMNEWRTGPNASIAALSPHFHAPSPVRSFPARLPVLPLDRIMVSHDAYLTEARVHDTPLARRASDHLPITATLTLPDPQC
ncbi:endonuclease/exonuclease/phosphatase family protein [Paragemmobacter straminiformis]|uniref:Endonuclease/exonuclease/phosphatase family protein n=1 Tax=Paragemmobacter straminiformis TaxID=2045119 RepID=A0A842IBF7_9RHOB|nr:endonuclease/exonuclease/phosphatase family protein [Gemmobacter straminiformis]MBC2836916.1 endonuclease/exonuclease/phosphatase family protein [Gemmobacter straminiformis]